jgi:signal transduction histidine kinase/ligand-binding sensor domain-containing protein/CheY-like chemotaxis protein/AraC-like DNA-binding protein
MRKTWAGICFLMLYFLAATGQTVNTPAFRAVSPPEGFTYSGIATIAEDPHGMIWFGAQHGLYTYDTEGFKKYLNIPDDPNSPAGNNIRNLFCDSSGKMWISTSSGLTYYDFVLERFVRCQFTDDDGNRINRNVLQVFEDKTKQIWLIDQRGLAKVDTINKTFRYSHFDPAPPGLSYALIAADATLWLGANNGNIYQSPYPYDSLIFFGRFRNALVQKILPVRNEVWIGYDWYGADKVGYDGKHQAHYANPSETGHTIGNSRVRDIYEDRGGRIWLATYKGISIVSGDQITNYDTENYPGINHSSVFEIYEDAHGGMWVGTWSGGLYYLNMHDNHFIHVKDLFHPNQNSNVISSFTDGPGNTILVGTESGLLFSYDILTREYDSYTLRNADNPLKSIKALQTDSKGNIWIGTFTAGIWVKTPGSPDFRQLEYMNNRQEQIYSLAEDGPKMWIGSGTTGLHSYTLATGETERFYLQGNNPKSLSNNSVRSVVRDKQGNLWVGTMNGLNFKEANQDGFVRYLPNQQRDDKSINHSEIFSLLEDRHGNIWIGTGGGGLNKYDPITAVFEHITTENGLVGREVYGILEDNSGNIWISTESGISMYDPRNKNVRNFTKEDGLQGNQFNPGACYKSDKGLMFFGGSNGFTCFAPSSIRNNPVPPTPLITSIAVNHEELKPGPESPLKMSSKHTDKITLQARQNSLTISFVANNYLQPGKNRFSYRLVNYDENWIEAGSERRATFTKIPPGKYVFEVMAANNDGVWNPEPRRLAINIRQPVLLRWYALLVYALLGILILYLVQREIGIRHRLLLEIREERLLREHEEKLSQMKMKFLTNITHEFKTPLSLILSPANHLLQKFGHDTDARFLLDIMKRNTTRLQWLIHQVIDLRKIDMNKLDVVKKPVNVVKLSHKIAECFMADARDKNIELVLETELLESYLMSDPDKLDIIITNLVSNAMKFTPEDGTVSISVENLSECNMDFQWVFGEELTGKVTLIKVTDTGPGISSDEIPQMFERFTQGKGHEGLGTGIGLSVVKEYVRLLGGFIGVSSEPSKGTLFSVCFPWHENIEILEDEPGDLSEIRQDAISETIVANGTELIDADIMVLIVEDDTDTRNYISGMLKKYFKVITASNGKQGYEKAVTTMPDVIITDVVMPGTGGFEMNRLLKENDLTSEIPVIIITAQSDPSVQIESLDAGADAFISKPFSEELLIAHIRRVLVNLKQRKTAEAEGRNSLDINEDLDNNDNLLVDKAIRIIEQNMMKNDFGVDKLASDLNMSRTSLYRKLKFVTGQSATEFIRYIRLKKALNLMESGSLSIEDISLTVGFNSHSYFSHCFRQHFGKTPSEFLMDKKGV